MPNPGRKSGRPISDEDLYAKLVAGLDILLGFLGVSADFHTWFYARILRTNSRIPKKKETKNMGKCVISMLPILTQKIQLYFTIDSKVHSKSFDFLDILHKGRP